MHAVAEKYQRSGNTGVKKSGYRHARQDDPGRMNPALPCKRIDDNCRQHSPQECEKWYKRLVLRQNDKNEDTKQSRTGADANDAWIRQRIGHNPL